MSKKVKIAGFEVTKHGKNNYTGTNPEQQIDFEIVKEDDDEDFIVYLFDANKPDADDAHFHTFETETIEEAVRDAMTWVRNPPTADQIIESAARDAEDAFWKVIAEKFPAVTSGDFPPDASVEFDKAREKAVRLWLQING